MFKFISLCKEVLGIKLPVEIRIIERSNKNAAVCETRARKGKLYCTVIKLYMPTINASKYDVYSIIAHELIHSVQFENDIAVENEYHGNGFPEIAAALTEFLKRAGYNCPDIYNPAVDID